MFVINPVTPTRGNSRELYYRQKSKSRDEVLRNRTPCSVYSSRSTYRNIYSISKHYYFSFSISDSCHIYTVSIEQCPSLEASSHSASEEIPCPLWSPKVHYRVLKSRSLVRIQTQINSLHPSHPV
jgi:hypothetical protein